MRRGSQVRLWLTMLLLAAVAMGVAVMKSRRTSETELMFKRRTTYSNAPGGARALYLTLDRLGYRTQRLGESFRMSSSPQAVMVLCPETPFMQSQWNRLQEWAKGGATVVIAWDLTPFNPEEYDPDHADPTRPPTLIYRPTKPIFAHRALDSGILAGSDRLALDEANSAFHAEGWPLVIGRHAPILKLQRHLVPLFMYQDIVVAGMTSVGAGRIVFVASGFPFSNEGIRHPDNLRFILNLLASGGCVPGHGVVVFDEYHHGYGRPRRLWDITPPLTRWGVWVLFAAVLLIFFSLSRRHRNPLPDRPPVRTRAEYLSSMSALFRKARATRLVHSQVVDDFCNRARNLLGAADSVSPDELFDRICRAAGVDPATQADLRTLLLSTAPQFTEHDLVRLDTELHDLLKEVEWT